MPQGPSFKRLVSQFASISSKDTLDVLKFFFGPQKENEGGEGEVNLDNADALKTLLELAK